MLKIERTTFIDSKGVSTYGYVIEDEDSVGLDRSYPYSLNNKSKEDNFDLIEDALNSFPEFFDKDINEGFTIEVDGTTINCVEFAQYLRDIASWDSLTLLNREVET